MLQWLIIFTSSNNEIDTEIFILLTKTTAARNGVALSYHGMLGLYFLAVVFASTIVLLVTHKFTLAINKTVKIVQPYLEHRR